MIDVIPPPAWTANRRFSTLQERQHNRSISTCLLTQFWLVPVQLAFIGDRHKHASLLANWQQRGRLLLPPYSLRRLERSAMAIYRLLQHSAFTPEDIVPIGEAYEDCLRILKLADRSDPLTEIIAKAIIQIAQTGVRDPVQIRELALKQLGTPPAE
jgi:hypothetical protein